MFIMSSQHSDAEPEVWYTAM